MKFYILSLSFVLTAFLFLGCGEDSGVSPETTQDDPARLSKPASSNVYDFTTSAVTGSASLRRNPNGISMTLQTTDIPSGTAITNWWVVFNKPDNCTNGIAGVSNCGEPDIFNPAVEADVMYAAGHVTGGGSKHTFAGYCRVGDTSKSIMPFFNALLGTNLPSVGLTNPSGAEVHLVVRTHEEAIPQFMPDMIRTFNGGCTYPPGVPTNFGAPGPNTCSDIQFAVFQP